MAPIGHRDDEDEHRSKVERKMLIGAAAGAFVGAGLGYLIDGQNGAVICFLVGAFIGAILYASTEGYTDMTP